jgi:ferredoxin
MTKKLVCDCNRSMPLDPKEMGLPIHTSLCRQEVGQFLNALNEPEAIVVACTQERALFSELATQAEKPLVAPLKFVNIREMAGWSQDASQSHPKIKALLALSDLPEPDAVPVVDYKSEGRLLIIGAGEEVFYWANRLGESLEVSVLCTNSTPLPTGRSYPVFSGNVTSLQGFLGSFSVKWELDNPIDPEMCTRCGACVTACPEDAIDLSFQIDLDKCKSHRACVTACAGIGAINFERVERAREGEFDLILDLQSQPSIQISQKPQGYFSPGLDRFEQSLAASQLLGMVGEFEKPKYFVYTDKICAHGRNGKVGCSECIDVCSTQAISSVFKDGQGKVEVNPNLCMGCGACATVCPSGAMRYNYPSVAYQGRQLRTLAQTYLNALGSSKPGQAAPSLLIHSNQSGTALLENLGRGARTNSQKINGLPAFVIPFGIEHIASTGMDLWFGALSYGFGEVILVLSGDEDPSYREALAAQTDLANSILQAMGYGKRIDYIYAQSITDLDSLSQRMKALRDRKASSLLVQPASFALSMQKRETLEMTLEHLLQFAPQALPADGVPLPAHSPIGGILVQKDACTLCMSCVGACPEGALLDNPDEPVLSFIEKQCVQCGLCEQTCPEQAITLAPRLTSIEQRKQKVTLNKTEPFHCISCGKAFGTLKMVELMLGRIGTHHAFSGDALDRLKMCSDCRVVDMMKKEL